MVETLCLLGFSKVATFTPFTLTVALLTLRSLPSPARPFHVAPRVPAAQLRPASRATHLPPDPDWAPLAAPGTLNDRSTDESPDLETLPAVAGATRSPKDVPSET